MATSSWARGGFDPEDMADLARRFQIGTRVKYVGTRGRHQGQTGTVVSYNWGNPHVMIDLDVRTEGGAIEKWQVGGPSTNRMEANGWHKTSLKLGDVITGSGYQFSDGQKVLRLQRITMPDGKVMMLYGR